MLLLHDFKGDRAAWKPFIPAFSRGWRIFALDLCGHGESLRQDMRFEGLTPLERDLRSPAHGWRREEALFDAGYLAETVRQAVAVYPMLQRSDIRAAWRLRGDSLDIDGKRSMREASKLDAPDVKQAALSILTQLDAHE